MRWSLCGPFRRTCSNSSIANAVWTSANNSNLARMGKYSKSLHKLYLTTPFNQSRSNSVQSVQVVAAHICVKTTAETDSLHLYVVDLPHDVEPELTMTAVNSGRVFLSCCSFLTWILLRDSPRDRSQFAQSTVAHTHDLRGSNHPCTWVCQFRATNQHQHSNVLSRSSPHSVSDAGHTPNCATWRPQLRLQMFALPFPSERDLRLTIGCLTARRVSVPAALGVLHRLQEP